MANPMYGQNKADDRLDASSRLVKVDLAVVGTTHAAGDHNFAWANPEGEDIIVEKLVIDITTAATGSCTLDAGVAADGTTTSDNLMDAVDVGAAAILTTNDIAGAGVNGKGSQPMTSSQWITGDFSASAAGLVGSFYVKYFIPSKAS